MAGVSSYTIRYADSSSPKTGMSYPLEAAGGGSYGGTVPQRPGGGYDINPYGGAVNPAANVSSFCLASLNEPKLILRREVRPPAALAVERPLLDSARRQTPTPQAVSAEARRPTPMLQAGGRLLLARGVRAGRLLLLVRGARVVRPQAGLAGVARPPRTVSEMEGRHPAGRVRVVVVRHPTPMVPAWREAVRPLPREVCTGSRRRQG